MNTLKYVIILVSKLFLCKIEYGEFEATFNIPLLVEDEAVSKSIKATDLSFHWRLAFRFHCLYFSQISMKTNSLKAYTWERWKVQRQMAISPWVRHTYHGGWGWAIFVSRVRHSPPSSQGLPWLFWQRIPSGCQIQAWRPRKLEFRNFALCPTLWLELRSSDNFNSCPIAFVLWCPLQSFLLFRDTQLKNGVSCFQKRCSISVWSCFKGCIFLLMHQPTWPDSLGKPYSYWIPQIW